MPFTENRPRSGFLKLIRFLVRYVEGVISEGRHLSKSKSVSKSKSIEAASTILVAIWIPVSTVSLATASFYSLFATN